MNVTPPEAEYEVQDIVAHSIVDGVTYFKVRWVGYSENEDTWEREDNLNCPQILQRYWDSLKNPKQEKEQNKVSSKQKIEMLQELTPKCIFGACKLKKSRIAYHVMFENNRVEWICSSMMARVWPELLMEYLESKLAVRFD